MVTLGDSAGTQTQDPQLRRLLLYPAELPDHPYLRCKGSINIYICKQESLFFHQKGYPTAKCQAKLFFKLGFRIAHRSFPRTCGL